MTTSGARFGGPLTRATSRGLDRGSSGNQAAHRRADFRPIPQNALGFLKFLVVRFPAPPL